MRKATNIDRAERALCLTSKSTLAPGTQPTWSTTQIWYVLVQEREERSETARRPRGRCPFGAAQAEQSRAAAAPATTRHAPGEKQRGPGAQSNQRWQISASRAKVQPKWSKIQIWYVQLVVQEKEEGMVVAHLPRSKQSRADQQQRPPRRITHRKRSSEAQVRKQKQPTLTELKGHSVSRARALAPGTQPTWITTKDTSNHGCLSKGLSLLPKVDNPSGTYRL